MLASLKNGCLGSAALCRSTIFEVIVALLSHFAQENVIFQNDFLTQITLPHTSLSLSLSPCLQPYATEQFQLSQVSVYDLLKLLLFPEYLWNPFRGKF